MSDIKSVTTLEDDKWIKGKTYHGNTHFCDWVKYKGSGNSPTPEELKQIEETRIEKADEYRRNNPYEPSKEYYEAVKRWPIKGN